MATPVEIRNAVESEIREAFRGVTLGKGISLRRAQSIDAGFDVHSDLPTEVTHDWCTVPSEELERDCTAHLDAEGFRYYIPALMMSVLNHYDSASMRVIGTLGNLYPKRDSWEYHMQRYSLLDVAQKKAIARFLALLPELVELDHQDQKIVPRALRNYWGQYLRTDATE